jgi:murein DD-endopeptidase MepM/ murein hydrolase activator NlpD
MPGAAARHSWGIVPILVMSVLLSGCRPAADESLRQSLRESLARSDIFLALETQTIEARVAPHATLEALLRGHDIRRDDMMAAIEAIRATFQPRNLLKAQQPYRLVRTLDGMLRSFEYQIDTDRFLRVLGPEGAEPAAFTVDVIEYEKTTELAALRAQIDAERSSLIAAVNAAGERVQLAIAVAELFAGDVDFESDLQPGDTLELLYERVLREGEFARYGPIVAARLLNNRRELQAYRFEQNGRADYFDEHGRSLRRPFLRSPLRFVPRVSSGFSHRRLHPVHRVYRPHLGVDYAAPHGSPVVAVAAGSVVSAGYSGAAGLMVRLRHTNGFESYYLHLSKLGSGVRAGARVQQGQLIGRVGATGTATGPHLDYRLRRNGVFVNPLNVHRNMPPGDPIAADLRTAFDVERGRVRELMSTTLLAQADASPREAVKAGQ